MLFNSYIFLFVCLPASLLGYYGLNYWKKYRLAQIFLIGMSLWFYGYFNVRYLAVIIGSIVINYSAYRGILRCTQKTSAKKIMAGAVILDLAILAYFKYMDFFIGTVNHVFGTEVALLSIALPLGISFFTFQQISFVVDAYRGEEMDYSAIDYICYVTFFPQLIAGPIVTHDELIPQFQDHTRRRVDWEEFARGIFIFSIGMAKKVLLADTFGSAADYGFQNIASLNTTNAVIAMLSYTFQIYLDFSGYCDMAVGIGKMFHLDLPVNFNSPYKSFTITEFWDRWHMTLTRFFTKYVYIPLGGNRKGQMRTWLNMMIVFLLSGLWHGAGWSFVFWGMCHGLFCVVTRRFQKWFDRVHPALNWLLTFGFVNVMWIFFRADTMTDGMAMVKKLLQLDFGPIDSGILSAFGTIEWRRFAGFLPFTAEYANLSVLCFFAVTLWCMLACPNAGEMMKKMKFSTGQVLCSAVLLVWCVFSFSGVSSFLYFNF